MGNKQKIFLVDNEPETLEIYSKKLKNQGHEKIVCCGDGEKLLKILPYSNMDIVISDIDMPNIGGRELLAELKKDKKTSNIRFVVISGMPKGNTEWLVKADAFIEKKHFPLLFNILSKYEKEQRAAENRIFKRYKKHKILTIDPNTNTVDSLIDVSLSGIGFTSKFSLELGSNLKIYVKAWGDKTYKSIEGKIIWKSLGAAGFRYGLKFEKDILPI